MTENSSGFHESLDKFSNIDLDETNFGNNGVILG